MLANLPPSRAQKRLALGVVLVLLVGFVIGVGPLSTLPLTRIDGFIPTYGTAIFVNDSILPSYVRPYTSPRQMAIS